jgi:hypothetical protein
MIASCVTVIIFCGVDEYILCFKYALDNQFTDVLLLKFEPGGPSKTILFHEYAGFIPFVLHIILSLGWSKSTAMI